jgi:RIMS-binding protein 2
LSFNSGNIITIIGDMDEDGFYMGELNGVRGLVPSNFLQEITTANSLMPSNAIPQKPPNAVGIMAGPVSAYGPPITDQQTRPKGVMFSDTTPQKPSPVRQISQTSSKTGIPPVSALVTSQSAFAQKPKVSTASMPGKPATKKGAEASTAKGATANASRKASQAAKKDTGKVTAD